MGKFFLKYYQGNSLTFVVKTYSLCLQINYAVILSINNA